MLHSGDIFLSLATVTDKKSRILAQSRTVIDRLGRHRGAAAAFAAVSALGVVTAFAVAPDDSGSVAQVQTIVERLSAPAATVAPTDPHGFLHEDRVQRGDTVATLFARLGISEREALDFLRTNATAQTISRQLRPGKPVTARTTHAGELVSLYFPVSGKESLIVVKRTDGRLAAHEEPLLLESRVAMRSGEIRYSLFGATDAAGIPDAIATQLAEIFSGDIDFHRDLLKGDRFSVVYETLHHNGQSIRSGRILAAEFVNDRKSFQAFWHTASADGKGGYYTAEGKSLKKAFLRSPLEFSRVTSGFTNNRFHPVLQTWRAHKGIDYGAPIGTKVRSVADGIIDFAGKQGGYGNLIVIRHQGSYSTAYGHLNGFAPGIRKGARVSQGETIGFVGQTGLASGPHLHYEFRIRDQQVNPLAVAMPANLPLEANQLPAFKTAMGPLAQHLGQAREFGVTQSVE